MSGEESETQMIESGGLQRYTLRQRGHAASGWTRRLALVLFIAVMPTSVWAWGGAGHRLIADLALERLTPMARAELDRLLQLEPGSSLATIATWADEVRSPGTAPWHFVNIPRQAGCRYDAERDCRNGKCIVAALTEQTTTLRSSRDDPARLQALKYIVHLVADAHQPLHSGYADDRGGNLYQVHAFGRGTNLHAVWDVTLIERWPGGLASLRVMVERALSRSASLGTPAGWVEESCRLMTADDFYPAGHLLSEEYVQRWRSALADRLAAAAARLAGTINGVLGGRP